MSSCAHDKRHRTIDTKKDSTLEINIDTRNKLLALVFSYCWLIEVVIVS